MSWSSTARKRRLAFRKCHTSPSLVDENRNSLVTSRQPQQRDEERFSPLERRVDDIAAPSKLAKEVKFQTAKRSRLKVLLSPRNPYEEFHRLFKDIAKEEFPINDYSCALSRDILLHGRLFISQNWLCFYSNIFGWETSVKLECKKIKSITRAKTAYMFPNAIMVRTEKKKYLFCSFLTRDAAYKLLSAVWQESNNKPDSGVEEVSANGDQDEESIHEEITEFADHKPHELAQELNSSKNHMWALKHHSRTLSCPNTPLSHHPTIEEASDDSHSCKEQFKNHTQQHERKMSTTTCLRKYLSGVMNHVLTLLNSLYSFVSSVSWLFKRLTSHWKAAITEIYMGFSLVILLISTVFLMNRISKLEKRFHDSLEGISEPTKITDEDSIENWGKFLSEREAMFQLKTKRLNHALNAVLTSVDNVRTTLKLIRDELAEPKIAQTIQ